MITPPAGTDKPVKLLALVPFNDAVNGEPSALNRSTFTVIAVVFVFTITSSVDQPPPAANCGSRTAPGPSTADAELGTVVTGARFVAGSVLKFEPRKRNPITETGRFEDPADVTASVPVISEGTDDVPVKSSVMNFDVCAFDVAESDANSRPWSDDLDL